MKSWLLFLLGALAYFFIRYANRTDKVKDFSIKFWWKDNMPELVASLVLPEGLVVSAKLVSSLACGLGLGAGVYELFKKKVKDVGK